MANKKDSSIEWKVCFEVVKAFVNCYDDIITHKTLLIFNQIKTAYTWLSE